MEIVQSRSESRPPAMIAGPTITLVNCNIRQESRENEERAGTTEFVYTQYRFESGEYECIRAGILPDGAQWDAELRRIERSARLDEADVCIAEAEDHVATGASGGAYLQALREYKMAVRTTVNQVEFPAAVEYPKLPENPF